MNARALESYRLSDKLRSYQHQTIVNDKEYSYECDEVSLTRLSRKYCIFSLSDRVKPK